MVVLLLLLYYRKHLCFMVSMVWYLCAVLSQVVIRDIVVCYHSANGAPYRRTHEAGDGRRAGA